MTGPFPWTYFYGSFIDLDVLESYGISPGDVRIARLDGFDIVIGPWATLVERDERSVYGILARVRRAELERLYAQEWVRSYHPCAVTVRTGDGALVPALCYIAEPSDSPRAGAVRFSGSRLQSASHADYVRTIVSAARGHGFPAWYIDRLTRLIPAI